MDELDGIIDENMKSLVAELNKLPGIVTLSCCGGHAERTNVSQCPEGDFKVTFEVDVLAGGYRSLQFIAWCAQRTDFHNLRVTTWVSSDYPESMKFDLEGTGGVDPNAMANHLANLDWPDDSI